MDAARLKGTDEKGSLAGGTSKMKNKGDPKATRPFDI